MTKHTRNLNVLRIDASLRRDGSVSRDLADGIVAALESAHGDVNVVSRDLAGGLPLIDADWIGANFTDPADRTDAHRETLALSDELVGELRAADTIVISTPVYNFALPAALKAWIDLIARARETFRYSEDGPVGLLAGRKAYVAVASGGTEMGSDIDFATGYLRHILGFVGIDDVTFVAADRLMIDAETSIAAARAKVLKIADEPARAAA